MTAAANRLLKAALALFLIIIFVPAFGQDIKPDHALRIARSSSSDKSQGPIRNIKPEHQKLAKGRFLVADSRVQGQIFGQSVILLISHDQNGSMGLIINRQTDSGISDLLPDVKGLAQSPDALYLGGPVSLNRFFLLVRSGVKPEESENIIADIYISQSKALLGRMADEKRPGEKFRLYAGYAGWGAGQLEAEVIRGDWMVVPADPEIIFDKDPAGIWDRLMPQKIDI